MDSDSALRLLGKYSKWQLICYFTLAFGFGMPYSWMMMSIVFIGDVPNYRCALAENMTVNESIPATLVDGVQTTDQCSVYREPGLSNATEPCPHGYWYDPASGYESTLITEWDLVCGKEWLVELSMAIQGIGTLIGAVLCNWLADQYGRKMVFLGCIWSNTVLAAVQAFSPNMAFYTVLSFLDGIQQQGMATVCFITCLELFPKEQRTFAGNAIEFVWVFGFVLLVPIAYGIRNWRYLQLAISLPMVLTISFYWILSESIPWLVLNGKTEEAEKVMRRAARWNKVTLPDRIFTAPGDDQSESTKFLKPKMTEMDDLVKPGNKPETELEENANEKMLELRESAEEPVVVIEDINYTFIDVLKSPKLRLYTIVLIFVWFVDCLGYTAISYTVTYLPGDRYLNFLLYSLIEIPGYGLTWILTAKVGRRIPMVIFHLLAGGFMIGTVVQVIEFDFDTVALVIVLSVLGKCFISAAYATLYLFSPELYPTNVRTTGVGICAMSAQIAGLVSPFARTLHRDIPWLPPVIIGVMFVAAGLLSLVLPETRLRELPSTIREVELWTEKKPENPTETNKL